MVKTKEKRTVDMQVMRDWVEPKSRVLDLGCGRGVLLDYLKQRLDIEAVGVDLSQEKISSAIKRGLSAYLGDMMEFMKAFPDQHFDRVICSRTLQELDNPTEVLREALRVSRHITIGFVNFAYWRNRLSMLLKGHRVVNEVYPTAWSESRPANPLSVNQFESFCANNRIEVVRHVFFRGNWKNQATFLPNLLCGYAIYELTSAD